MTTVPMCPNKYAKRCDSCGIQVPELAGFAVQLEGGRWGTYCRSSQCLPQAAQTRLTARRLHADGRVEMPYEGQPAIDIIKQMPGRRFIPKDQGGPYWVVSTHPRDRAQVLHYAQTLKLDVAPEWLVAADFEDAAGAGKVPAAVINAAVERAQKAGAYPYQVLGVRFITERKRCLLGDAPGLGKTAQSLLSIPDGYGALIVVPASVKLNWQNECRRWRPDLKPRVLDGGQTWESLMPRKGEVLITNPDSLPKENPVALTMPVPVMVIADEAHLYKNVQTARHKLMRQLCSLVDRVCIMTGTPMTNKPPDLWGTLAVADLAKEAFTSLIHFRQLFGAVKAGLSWEWGDPDPSVPTLLRRVMLRRTQEEVLPDLPPYTEKVHTCSKAIDAELLDTLDELYENVKKELDANELPEFTRMAKVRSLLSKAKIAEMHDIIESFEEQDTPLVVFSAHKAPVQSAATRAGWALITGDTTVVDRQAIVEKFQRGELKGLALTIAAGGVGITLTHAAHMLFVDLDWTPALNHQAMCRIRRIGQKADHLSYTRMAFNHPLDLRVEELLAWKTEMFRLAIDNVTEEYKVPEPLKPVLPTIAYTPPVAEILVETLEQRSMRKAMAAAEMAAEAAKRQLVAARAQAESLRSEHIAVYRAKRAAASLPQWLSDLRHRTPPFVGNCIGDRGSLRAALAYMLRQCDGAKVQDDVGFNKVDATVASYMVLLDIENDAEAAEAAARLLFKYRRQLRDGSFGHLYTTDKEGTPDAR